MTKKAKNNAADMTFTAAIAELEKILRRVESDDADIDRLAAELEKASTLLELCRSKIRKAEVEVSQIVKKMEPDGS